MTGYNTSSAYKLPAYETAAPAVPRSRQRPQLRVVGKRNPKLALAAAFSPRVLCAFSIVVSLLCLMIYNQVKLHELTGAINERTKELTTLESGYVRMASTLESAISLRTVEQQAREFLGMDRLDKHQTEYVNLYQDDKIVLAKEQEKSAVAEQAQLIADSFFGNIKEYIAAG